MDFQEQVSKDVICPRQQKVQQLTAIIYDIRDKLQECKVSVCELTSLQLDFQSRVRLLNRKFAEKMEKNVNQAIPQCYVTATMESEANDQSYRRWNSDLSLDLDVKTNLNRSSVEDPHLHVSSDAVTIPIIRPTSIQRKPSSKAKFTSRLDAASVNIPSKRPGENFLLSDLGFTSQAPEFSQSEFNLSSEDHWQANDNNKTSGRVRFLSHDDGHSCLKALHPEGIDNEFNKCGKMSQSGSWVTLTQSERDFSEMDSTFSLNCQHGIDDVKVLTSTPLKMQGLRSRLKQSASCNDLVQSKSSQSLPNLPKPSENNSWISGDLISPSIRSCDHKPVCISSHQSKRYSMAAVEVRQNVAPSNVLSSTTANPNIVSSSNRRSSIAGEIENGPYVPSTISSLYLGGRVKALYGGHLVISGIVWYRGRLPGINDDFVGIEIDQVGLGGDGTYLGHRYFRCAPGRGLFVPFRKIIMAWPPNLP